MWSNIASARFDHLLIYFLIYFLLLIWTISRFWASRLDFLSLFFIFYKTHWMKCSLCKCTFKVKGCPNGFWDSLLMFYLNTYLLVPFVISFTSLLTLVRFFLCNPYVNSWAHIWPKLFGLPIGPFGAWLSFFLHLSWKDQLHFHKVHCTSGLFAELGTLHLLSSLDSY